MIRTCIKNSSLISEFKLLSLALESVEQFACIRSLLGSNGCSHARVLHAASDSQPEIILHAGSNYCPLLARVLVRASQAAEAERRKKKAELKKEEKEDEAEAIEVEETVEEADVWSSDDVNDMGGEVPFYFLRLLNLLNPPSIPGRCRGPVATSARQLRPGARLGCAVAQVLARRS